MNLASIPSPPTGVWHLGPIPLRAYAACIVLGIIVACVVMERRLRARGVPEWTVLDIAIWAVPCGIVGARIYHVITDPELYFAAGRDWVGAFKIWDGGLGIWGGVAGGAVGAWIACRRRGIPLSLAADALAPGLPLAQAIGRWGNYFNQELMGRPSTLPWAVRIDIAHRPVGYEQYATFQPTFLYECIWDIAVAVVVWLLDRRYRYGRGRAFALYVMLYVIGRGAIEALRIDPANHIFGLRLNDWVSILVFLGAAIYFVAMRTRPRQHMVVGDDGGLTVVNGDAEVTEVTPPPAPADNDSAPAGDIDDADPPPVTEPDDVHDADDSAGDRDDAAQPAARPGNNT